MTARARWGLSLVLATVCLCGRAWALPAAGARVAAIPVEDASGRARSILNERIPVLVFYEDRDASGQNARARIAVGKFSDRPENRSRFELIAVADVEKWNFWPARKYVRAEIQSVSKRDEAPVLLDWTGAVRRSWGLTRGKSGVLLIAPDGRVLFAGEGTLSDHQLDEVTARLLDLGAVR